MRYTIHTPNAGYSADWLGVRFERGVGSTDNETVAAAARRLGYTVTVTEPEPAAEPTVETPVTASNGSEPSPVRKPRRRKTEAS